MIPGSGVWRARVTATGVPVTDIMFCAKKSDAGPVVPGPSKFQFVGDVALSVSVSV